VTLLTEGVPISAAIMVSKSGGSCLMRVPVSAGVNR
jgi:hypothetical protein